MFQVLCSSSSARDQLPQEEVRAHEPAASQEEVEVNPEVGYNAGASIDLKLASCKPTIRLLPIPPTSSTAHHPNPPLPRRSSVRRNWLPQSDTAVGSVHVGARAEEHASIIRAQCRSNGLFLLFSTLFPATTPSLAVPIHPDSVDGGVAVTVFAMTTLRLQQSLSASAAGAGLAAYTFLHVKVGVETAMVAQQSDGSLTWWRRGWDGRWFSPRLRAKRHD